MNYEKIKSEYITGDKTLKDLAAEYGCPYNTLAIHSSKGKWTSRRKKYRQEVGEKALSARKKADEKKVLETLSDIGSVNEALVKKIKNMISTRKLFPQDMANISRALKTCTEIARDVYGAPTKYQMETLRLADERLKIEKDKNTLNISEEEYGVVELPEVQNG